MGKYCWPLKKPTNNLITQDFLGHAVRSLSFLLANVVKCLEINYDQFITRSMCCAINSNYLSEFVCLFCSRPNDSCLWQRSSLPIENRSLANVWNIRLLIAGYVNDALVVLALPGTSHSIYQLDSLTNGQSNPQSKTSFIISSYNKSTIVVYNFHSSLTEQSSMSSFEEMPKKLSSSTNYSQWR